MCGAFHGTKRGAIRSVSKCGWLAPSLPLLGVSTSRIVAHTRFQDVREAEEVITAAGFSEQEGYGGRPTGKNLPTPAEPSDLGCIGHDAMRARGKGRDRERAEREGGSAFLAMFLSKNGSHVG